MLKTILHGLGYTLLTVVCAIKLYLQLAAGVIDATLIASAVAYALLLGCTCFHDGGNPPPPPAVPAKANLGPKPRQPSQR